MKMNAVKIAGFLAVLLAVLLVSSIENIAIP